MGPEPPGAPFPHPPTQSPLPWTDSNVRPSATGQENKAASPITEFISLVGLSEQRIYCLIHFEQNLFLEIFMMEE